MAKHDNTQDGGRDKKDVDVSKIVPPKDTGGKHTKDEGKDGGKK